MKGSHKKTLTIQPFGVILESPFEVEPLLTCSKIKEVISKYDRVRFSKFGVSARVKSWQAAGIALRDPHRSAIVCWVVGALGNPQAHSWHVFVPR